MNRHVNTKRWICWNVALCLLWPIAGMAIQSPSAQATPALRNIPANSVTRIVHTIHGKKAALQATLQAGIRAPTVRTQSGTSPFDEDSTDVSVVLTSSRAASTYDTILLPPHASEGDTVTYTWRQGCGMWTETFTYTGGQWPVTSVSWKEIPKCGAASIG